MRTVHLRRDRFRTWCGRIGAIDDEMRVAQTKHQFLVLSPSKRCSQCGRLRDHNEAKQRGLKAL